MYVFSLFLLMLTKEISVLYSNFFKNSIALYALFKVIKFNTKTPSSFKISSDIFIIFSRPPPEPPINIESNFEIFNFL